MHKPFNFAIQADNYPGTHGIVEGLMLCVVVFCELVVTACRL